MIECSICSEQRNELLAVKSKVKETMTLNVCRPCIAMKREPRWLLILVGKDSAEGYKSILPFIKHHRYVGDEIPLSYFL